jgi:TolB-like protein/DNA-binding SARP family transcriptional activator
MIELRTLGTLDLRGSDGHELTSILVHPKRTALLTFLAAPPAGRFHRRDALIPLFWPELDQEHARAALRKSIHYLRRSLGEGVLVGRGDEELALEAPPFRCDAAAFANALEERDYARALELYRGPFLEAFFVSDAPEFERWLDGERARLHDAAFDAAWKLAEQAEAAGEAFGASFWGRRAAALAPASDAALRRLLSLLERLGDRAGAVSAYEEFARRLLQEYNLEPSPETEALVRSIRSTPDAGGSAASLARAAPPARRDPAPAAAPSPTTAVALAEESVAVLPFANLSPDPENEYLSDGLTEELIFALARVAGLRVAARTSAFAFKGKDTDIREIGRKLGVANLVEGSVRRVGNRLRITAQLVSAADGYSRWSQTYARELEDVFAIQAEISQAILSSLLPRLGGTSGRTLVQQNATESVEAYELYLRGGHAFRNGTGEETLRRAAALFEQAVRTDPSYAPAYAGLADAYMTLAGHAPPDEVMPAAKAAALRSIELDPRLAEGYVALASIEWQYDWNWPAADQHYRLSLSVNPLLHTRCVCYAWYLAAIGELDTAVIEAERARLMDPLARLPTIVLAWMYHLARRDADARQQLAEVLAADPRDVSARRILAWIYWAESAFDRALAELEGVREDFDARGGFAELAPPLAVADSAVLYARSARRADAIRLLEGLERRALQGYVPPEQVAAVNAALGQMDEAFRWLDRAYAHRSNLAHFFLLPLAEALRADARCGDMLRRIGLERAGASGP